MRKLASIQRIWQIEPIEGADRIELAHVLGWLDITGRRSRLSGGGGATCPDFRSHPA